jgi:hypothetical protein
MGPNAEAIENLTPKVCKEMDKVEELKKVNRGNALS